MISALLRGLCALCLLCSLALAQEVPDSERLTPQEVTELTDMLDATMTATGDYAQSEQNARQLYGLVLRDFGAESAQAIAVERLIVMAATLQGRDTEGLSLAMQMMEKSQRVLSADDPLAYRAVAAYGVAANIAGEPDAALDLLAQGVIEADKNLPAGDLAGDEMRLVQAGIAAQEKDYALANSIYETLNHRLAGRDDQNSVAFRSFVMLGWAQLANDVGDMSAAADLYTKAIDALDQQFSTIKHPHLQPVRLVTTGRLAVALMALDRHADVPPLLRPLLEEVTAVYGKDSRWWAEIAFPLAVAIVANEENSPRAEEALTLMQGVVANWSQIYDVDIIDLVRARLNLAVMLANRGRYTEALEQIRQMDGAALPGSRMQMVYVLREAEVAGTLTKAQAVDAVLDLLQAGQTSGAAAAQRLLAERLASGSSENAALLRAQTDARGHRQSLQTQLSQIAALPLADRDEAQTQDLRDQLESAQDAETAAKAMIRDKAPNLAAATGRLPLNLAEIQAALAPEQALVVIDSPVDDQDVGLIVAITSDTVDWHSFVVSSAEIEASVATLRDSITLRLGVRSAAALDGQAENSTSFDLKNAHWLYQETVGRVEDILKGKTDLLFDLRGVIGTVPPALLVASPPASDDLTKADWLIRRSAITILPAISALRTPSATVPPGTGFLAFADADFANAPWLAGLQPLPETAAEVRDVGAAFGVSGETLYLGNQALESRAKSADLSQIGVLYFATHGLKTGDVLGNVALPEPGLALTPDVSDDGDDGVLLASDIAQLHLNARVVVLSACNTASGDTSGGEALSGLAQSFLYAGARSLLVSHWPVESRSAVALMTGTFRAQTTGGIGLAQAQRQAMLAMIDHPKDPRWSHPAYWAPFVFVGK